MMGQGPGSLPMEPRDRLAWFFDTFAYSELPRHFLWDGSDPAAEEEWDRLKSQVMSFAASSGFWQSGPVTDEDVRRAQVLVRETFEALLDGQRPHHRLQGAELVVMLRRFLPGPTTWRYPVIRRFQVDFPSTALLAALDYLDRTPEQVLRRCPYPTAGGGKCGRLFVGRKRQTWCVDHQDLVKRERNRRAQEERRKRLREGQAGKRSGGRRKRGTKPSRER